MGRLEEKTRSDDRGLPSQRLGVKSDLSPTAFNNEIGARTAHGGARYHESYYAAICDEW